MQHPIILFDGVCNLCTGSVKFIIKRDKKDLFRFAALQSHQAAQKLKPFNVNPADLNTIILLEEGKLYKKSTAALRIARHLKGGWSLL